MRKTNNYETLLKKNNEYFEFTFTVNEMFQKFVFCESSDEEGRHNTFSVEIFLLPFKDLFHDILTQMHYSDNELILTMIF